MSKVDYVRAEAARNRTFDHHCHWTGCEKSVPPAMWGCKQHWFMLPARLRARVWRAYRPGQEISKDPSAEYLAVAREVQDWIAARDSGPKPNGRDREDGLGAKPEGHGARQRNRPTLPSQTPAEESNND